MTGMYGKTKTQDLLFTSDLVGREVEALIGYSSRVCLGVPHIKSSCLKFNISFRHLYRRTSTISEQHKLYGVKLNEANTMY